MNNIEEVNISDYADKSYLDYAMSVVIGRALPFVGDGFKPVHRRIFYAMHKMGITDTSKPVKSARVTGEVIGKYHPHGDVSVYDAIVLQTQSFKMNYPIVEGIGNFGSRDGDSAGAQRYTECKFNPISKTILDEIDLQAVDFIPNYDGNDIEPVALPVRLPFILMNYTEGIAVGVATNIPSHNINEVIDACIAYYENSNISLEEVLQHIKGPDFPTAGQLISSPEDIAKVYAEGKGPLRLRGKYHIEDAGTKKWKLVFDELPFNISVKNIIEEIDAIFNPEDKIKKDAKGKDKKISPEQARLKLLFLNSIGNFLDESDKTNPVRIVIEPKSFKQSPEELALILLSTTSLETNFNANFVVIGNDKKPRQKSLLEILSEWTQFRLDTIEKRCKYQLQKTDARIHILDGRKIILDHIEEVIQIIKHSKQAKLELMEKYNLSEIQAQDVLTLQLRQVGNLEVENLNKEHSELNDKKNELEKILSSQNTLKKQAIKELKMDKLKYSSPRKTLIAEAEKVNISAIQEKSAKVSEEEITVAISSKDWIKVFKGIKNIEDISFKDGEKTSYIFHCKNTDTLAMMDIEGKIYNYPLNELSKDGVPINTLAQFNSKLSLVYPINKNTKYFMLQNSGYGFITHGNNLQTKMKAGKEMITIENNGEIIQPLFYSEQEDISSYKVAILTSENKFILFKLSDVSEIGKGKGVALCSLPENQYIMQVKLLKENSISFILDGKVDKPIVVEGDELLRYERNRSSSVKGQLLNLKQKFNKIKIL